MKLGHAGLFLAATLCLWGCNGIETAYQRHTDETRIRHVKQIAELAETFKDNEGHYPHERLEDGDYRTFRLARGAQLYEVPDDHDDLAQLMQQGIAEPFNLPYDPQNVAVYTNRFYAYWSDGQRYAVSARLGTSHPGAVHRGRYHFVYTIEPGGDALRRLVEHLAQRHHSKRSADSACARHEQATAAHRSEHVICSDSPKATPP